MSDDFHRLIMIRLRQICEKYPNASDDVKSKAMRKELRLLTNNGELSGASEDEFTRYINKAIELDKKAWLD